MTAVEVRSDDAASTAAKRAAHAADAWRLPARNAPVLDDETVQLWLCRIPDVDAALLPRYVQLLSADERERMARYRFEPLRRRFLVSRALLRTTLSRYFPHTPADAWSFDANDYGKPRIAAARWDGRLQFNLSHAGDWVALAVGLRRELGVDVERIEGGQDGMAIAGRYFSAPECAWLHRLDPTRAADAFIELWTLKEAYLKALGTGLSTPLTSVTFALDALPALTFDTEQATEHHWRFMLAALPDRCRLAVSVRGTAEVPDLHIDARSSVPLGEEAAFALNVLGGSSGVRVRG